MARSSPRLAHLGPDVYGFGLTIGRMRVPLMVRMSEGEQVQDRISCRPGSVALLVKLPLPEVLHVWTLFPRPERSVLRRATDV
ncbi:hypothetical protein R20943_07064 [Paraburkholderia aspalathi]|nr:hypothetical protein R20943_07064 [Paraburkholderia aspalathi]